MDGFRFAMTFSALEIGLLMLGALLGGFANGLTGFGTALTAVPIWIHIASPPFAAALGAAAGVAGQLQTIGMIRHAIEWRVVAPFILPGLAGVPIGTWLIPAIDVRHFKIGVGLVLIVYCAFQLWAERIARSGFGTWGGRVGDAVIGFVGGVMSGLAGLSGPPPIMWATFKPWTRDQKRALFQSFNLTILSATLVSSFAAGLLPRSFFIAVLVCVPTTYIGVRLGAALYKRLDDRRYDRLVVSLLLIMGVSLVAMNW